MHEEEIRRVEERKGQQTGRNQKRGGREKRRKGRESWKTSRGGKGKKRKNVVIKGLKSELIWGTMKTEKWMNEKLEIEVSITEIWKIDNL